MKEKENLNGNNNTDEDDSRKNPLSDGKNRPFIF